MINYLSEGWPLVLWMILLAFLLHRIIYFTIKWFSTKSNSELVVFAHRKLRYPTLLAFILVAVKIAVNQVDIEPDIYGTLQHIASILLIITITWTLGSAVKIFRQYSLSKYDVTKRDNLLARKRLTQFKVLERIIITVIAIIGVAAVLMTFESIRSFGASLLASAGIAGIIIGFAAQRSIATFLAGIQIAITQPIRLDDAVVVEGEWGWIEEITFTYVVIRIWDKRRLVLPINYFIENPFQNWTKNSSDILGAVFLYTDYTVPVDAIRKKLDEILESTDLWDRKAKVVQVTDATERTMEIRVLVSGSDSPTTFDLRVLVREKLIDFLQREYPSSLPKSRVWFENEIEKESETRPPKQPKG